MFLKRKKRARKARTGGSRMTSLGDLRLSHDDRAGGGPAPRQRRSGQDLKPGRRRTPKHVKRKLKPRRGPFGRMVYGSFVLGIWAVIGVLGFVGWHAMHLPPPEELSVPERPANIMVVAADGTMLGNRGETGGEEVRLFELPRHLPQAVLAIEDRRFYSHFGFDPVGLVRAASVNFTSGGVVQGGSTITQQLAKNLFLKPDRTLRRKIHEVMLALWLEYQYSKDQILEMYLNRAYLGAGATGVEAAARVYYDKSAREVTLAEAATIAGLLQAPSRYAPTRNPDIAHARSTTVLGAMVDVGFINQEQAKQALLTPAEVKPGTAGGSVGYVADWVAEVVPTLIGEVRQDIVVETTVETRLQKEAEAALVAVIDSEGAERNVSEGAVVAMDPDGAVRALVGGRNYMRSQYNRAVKAKRQPGSAFKPFVYLAAIEAGLSPETLRTDAPIQFGNWSPSNYSNEFKGPMRLTDALTQSINTISVRLTDEVGPDAVIEAAHRMGIGSEMGRNLSLALGTSEVSPLEMVAAYAPLANGGYGIEPYVVRRIRTTDGDVLYERRNEDRGRVISEETVGAMNHMMRRIVEAGTGRGAAFGGWPVAGKTGTSQEFRDAWFIGYTSNMVAGVWLGNDDSKPTKRVTGGSLPAKVWRDFMEDAHEGVIVAELPGHYVADERHIVVDQSLPWLQGQHAPTRVAVDPSQPIPPPQSHGGGGFFQIDGGFLKRLFGG